MQEVHPLMVVFLVVIGAIVLYGSFLLTEELTPHIRRLTTRFIQSLQKNGWLSKD